MGNRFGEARVFRGSNRPDPSAGRDRPPQVQAPVRRPLFGPGLKHSPVNVHGKFAFQVENRTNG
jgi:hypothetical protein